MERLISLIPEDLKQVIFESSPENISAASSSLLEFLRPLPNFQRVIAELTDPELALCRKNLDAARELKRQGNECFSNGDYPQSLRFYSEALRHAPMNSSDTDNSLVATLYVNRATALQKMNLLEESIRDCNRALVLSPTYAKAWYRKGKANSLLQHFNIAINDLQVALSVEESSSGKKHIQEDFEKVLRHSEISSLHEETCAADEIDILNDLGDRNAVSLRCVSTVSKGRGFVAVDDIPPASVVHSEEPLAAIVMKSVRETHCHFCFNVVPADVTFCYSCTIPVYCSQSCQGFATGVSLETKERKPALNLPENLEKHVTDTISSCDSSISVVERSKQIQEHRHECGGVHWPAVLPPDIVLAGRVIVISSLSSENGQFSKKISLLEDLSHNYFQFPPISKLELQMYAVVLTYCLHHYNASDYPLTGQFVTQVAVLLCQIKINSMAVVHVKSIDEREGPNCSLQIPCSENSFISRVEQVRVGQALYLNASLFNHSCMPNLHAYFLSRKLFLRSTEHVPAGFPLELSYGPQVGQWDLLDRQKLLYDQYYFKCKCVGCSELNFPDLVINAFHCINTACTGAVLESVHFRSIEDRMMQASNAYSSCNISLPASRKEKDLMNVAYMIFEESNAHHHFYPGCCLSCGSMLDLRCSSSSSTAALLNLQKFRDSIDLHTIPDFVVSDSLEFLDHLRSARHPCSRILAQAEDCLAEVLIKFGEFGHALQHCNTSVKILEKLYHSKHIVVGNELIKLASIQLGSGDCRSALDCIEQIDEIFSLHYGSHVGKIFPFLKKIREAAKVMSSSSS